MKKLLIIATITALCSAGAFAQSSSTSASTSSASTYSKSNSNASTGASTATNGNASNAQTIDFTTPANTTSAVNYSGSETVYNVPSVNGPALVSSNDTCMGSTSGSLNVAGLGFGGGATWVDGNCKMLKNSRELWNMGMKTAALALMCTDAANKDALELTGYMCPQTRKARIDAARAEAANAKAEAAAQYSGSDPIVRARLGLAPK